MGLLLFESPSGSRTPSSVLRRLVGLPESFTMFLFCRRLTSWLLTLLRCTHYDKLRLVELVEETSSHKNILPTIIMRCPEPLLTYSNMHCPRFMSWTVCHSQGVHLRPTEYYYCHYYSYSSSSLRVVPSLFYSTSYLLPFPSSERDARGIGRSRSCLNDCQNPLLTSWPSETRPLSLSLVIEGMLKVSETLDSLLLLIDPQGWGTSH